MQIKMFNGTPVLIADKEKKIQKVDDEKIKGDSAWLGKGDISNYIEVDDIAVDKTEKL